MGFKHSISVEGLLSIYLEKIKEQSMSEFCRAGASKVKLN